MGQCSMKTIHRLNKVEKHRANVTNSLGVNATTFRSIFLLRYYFWNVTEVVDMKSYGIHYCHTNL